MKWFYSIYLIFFLLSISFTSASLFGGDEYYIIQNSNITYVNQTIINGTSFNSSLYYNSSYIDANFFNSSYINAHYVSSESDPIWDAWVGTGGVCFEGDKCGYFSSCSQITDIGGGCLGAYAFQSSLINVNLTNKNLSISINDSCNAGLSLKVNLSDSRYVLNNSLANLTLTSLFVPLVNASSCLNISPSCSVSLRGLDVQSFGGSGVKDFGCRCMKNSTDGYQWIQTISTE